MNNKVYVIIVNYYNWEDTIECLESLLKLNYSNFQILVVDNNSPNKSVDNLVLWAKRKIFAKVQNNKLKYLIMPFEKEPVDYIEIDENDIYKSYSNKIIFIKAQKNNGFAAGNNIGIKYAQNKNDFEYLWLLNNDTVVEKNSLKYLLEYSKINNIDISGSKLLYYYNINIIQGIGGKVNKFLGNTQFVTNDKDKIDYVIGASFFISKQCINSIGLLPEEYFLYYEEVDYCFTAIRNGLSIGVSKNSVVYHKEGATIGNSNQNISKKNETMDLLHIKNKFKFHKKFLKNKLGLYISAFITIVNRIKRKQFSRIFKIIKILYEVEKN